MTLRSSLVFSFLERIMSLGYLAWYHWVYEHLEVVCRSWVMCSLYCVFHFSFLTLESLIKCIIYSKFHSFKKLQKISHI